MIRNDCSFQVRCAEAALELVPIPLPCKSQQLRVSSLYLSASEVLLAQFLKAQYVTLCHFMSLYVAQYSLLDSSTPRSGRTQSAITPRSSSLAQRVWC